MTGRKSRDKGNRLERALVAQLQAAGFGAERVPLSGSLGGRWTGDITLPLLGRDLVVEAKTRGNGFRQIYDWIENRDLLALKANRKDVLIVIRLRQAVEIAKAAERNREGRA